MEAEPGPTIAVMVNRPGAAPWMGAPALASLCLSEFVGLGALLIPTLIGLPVLLIRMGDARGGLTPEQALAIITSTGAACGMLVNLTAGWLSDRTKSARYGRLPWVAGGAIIGGAFLPLVPTAESVTELALWWLVSHLGYSAMFSTLIGTFSDLASPGERARVSGWFAASATGTIAVAMMVVAFLPKSEFVFFGMMPLLSIPVVSVSLVVLGRRIQSSPVHQVLHLRETEAEDGWKRQFWLLVVQRACTQFAYGFAILFSVLYLVRRFGFEAGGAATWASATTGVAALAGMVAAILSGRWAARLGSTPLPMRLGIALIFVGLAALIAATDPWIYVGAVVVVGIGYGTYTAVDFALVLRVVPVAHAARFLGLFNIARALPQAVTPSIAPLLLALGNDVVGQDRTQNFAAFYAVGAVLALLGLVLVSALRVKSPDQALI